jgi:hypothetical protein
MGTERIPVTGERAGADAATSMFCFQFKLRRSFPGWLWEWLSGIRSSAAPSGRVGVLVLKKPRQKDAEALVVLSWKDWCDLHGTENGSERVV